MKCYDEDSHPLPPGRGFILGILQESRLSTAHSQLKSHSRIFYGWYVVFACLIITLYTGGVVNFGFTAVFDPLAKEFGWSYAQISFASSLRGLEVGLLSAVMGLLVDRWGPKRLIIGGSALIFLGYIVLSRVSSLFMFYMAFALISLGMSACAGPVLLAPVTHWFKRKAGIATGLVASGFGLGGTLVPLVTGLIDAFQWRTAMTIVGIGVLAICLPLAFLVRHRPEPYGYLPDGDTGEAVPEKGTLNSEEKEEVNYTVWQALKDRAFWHVSLSSMCHSFVVGAIVTHVMPYLGSVGIARSTASVIALVLPLCSVAGRLSSGWFSGKVGSRVIYSSSFVLMTVGLLAFSALKADTMWLVVPFVACFSIGWGFSVISRITLLREHYGRESFGGIIGFNSTIMMIGNVSGAPIAGWSYDHFGSYQGAWIVFGLVTLGGMAIALTAPGHRRQGAPLAGAKAR
jgi:sugar phosphate permease